MKDAYKIISEHYTQYKRLDSTYIEVRNYGYCSLACINLEQDLKDIDVIAVKRNFDRKSNETITVYKQPSRKK